VPPRPRVRHASSLVRVPPPARLLHASFRPRLATTPWRFAIPSPPSSGEEDFHLQAVPPRGFIPEAYALLGASPVQRERTMARMTASSNLPPCTPSRSRKARLCRAANRVKAAGPTFSLGLEILDEPQVHPAEGGVGVPLRELLQVELGMRHEPHEDRYHLSEVSHHGEGDPFELLHDAEIVRWCGEQVFHVQRRRDHRGEEEVRLGRVPLVDDR
jgi:hypothetical protein